MSKQDISPGWMVLILVLLLWPAVSWAVDLSFSFAGNQADSGWSNTPGATVTKQADHWRIQASNWDSKIYRRIDLPAGRYNLYGSGAGEIRLILTPDWKDQVVILNLSGENYRTDYRDFQAPGGPLFLVVQAYGSDVQARIQWLKIQDAPPVPAQDVPDPAVLAAQHPQPEIVRGFMSGDLHAPAVFQDMRSWGANVVRLQIYPVQRAQALHKSLWDAWPTILDEVEAQVKRASAAEIKVVVDLHQAPVTGVARHDMPELWACPDLEKNFCRVWHDLAQRLLPYKDTIWGYDLYNEPLDRNQLPWPPRQWHPLAVKILRTIRAVDRDTWIIFEPGPGSMFRGFEGLRPLPDTHVIYSAHFYSPMEFTHQGIFNVAGADLAHAMEKINVHYPSVINDVQWDKTRIEAEIKPAEEFQAKWHVPIYVGEFSVVRWAPRDDAVRWLKDVINVFETRGWSWSYHAFREFNGWSLEHDETFWREGMPAPQPAAQETARARVVKEALKKNTEHSQLTSGQPVRWSDAARSFRILYVGDSITRHGFNADTAARLKWDHVAGMAASSEDKDYAHRLAALIQQTMPARKVEVIFDEAGGDGSAAGRLAAIDQYQSVKPNLVVIQLGEHEQESAGAEALRHNYEKLVTAFATRSPRPLVLCTGRWEPDGGRVVDGKADYEGWPGVVEHAMEEVCKKHGIAFVSVAALALDPSCRGWGEHSGVRWHPNDKGQEGYAQRLFAAFQRAGPPFVGKPIPLPGSFSQRLQP